MSAKKNNRGILIGLMVVQLISITILGLYNFEVFTDWHDDSLEIYHAYAGRLLNGEVPYRDYSMEYPPLAILAFCLPNLLAFGRNIPFEQYVKLYLLSNVLISLAASVIAVAISRRWCPRRLNAAHVVSVGFVAGILFTPLFAWRYDFFPALFTLLALFLLIDNKPLLSGLSLGIAVSAKLYPLVIIPVFMIYYLVLKNYHALKRFIFGGLISTLALIPFFILAPKWVFQFLGYHQQRGLHIETSYSGLIMLGHSLKNLPIKIVSNFSAFHLVSPAADFVVRWLPYGLILSFVIVLIFCYQDFRETHTDHGFIPTESLVNYIVIALIVFILTNKVFSPQFMVWILPFIPFVKFRYASLMMVAAILTLMIFPIGYHLLIEAGFLSIVLLNLRNSLLLGTLLWLLFGDRATKCRKYHEARLIH